MRTNRDSRTLMRECRAHNHRRLKFCRCDISAEGNAPGLQRRALRADRPDLTASGGEGARNDSSDAREVPLSLAAGEAPPSAPGLPSPLLQSPVAPSPPTPA